jgi:hypothetical protein
MPTPARRIGSDCRTFLDGHYCGMELEFSHRTGEKEGRFAKKDDAVDNILTNFSEMLNSSLNRSLERRHVARKYY